MTRIWFDTEFYENGRTIELISIGLVREDNVAYYAETTQARMLCEESPWLMANVLPHLIGQSAVKHKQQMAEDIVNFCGPGPEFWADYASYDWVVLCQIYGRMIDLPPGWPMFCRDVQQLKLTSPHAGTMRKLIRRDEHNALADAKECKEKYEWLAQ